MNEIRRSLTNPNDDIDFLILLERIVLYFRKFKIAYLVAIILGILLGVALYFSFPKVYKARMVLEPSFLTNQDYIQIIDQWNELLKNEQEATVAQTWNCDQQMLYKVVEVKGIEIMKVFSPSNPNGFYIDAKITDNGILPALQEAVVHGLNNTEYVREKLAIKTDNLKQMVSNVTKEITKVDSLKTSVQNIITNKEKNSSSLMVDISGLNRQLIDLQEKLLGYKEELKFISGVHVLQGFSRSDKPVSISLKVLIILGLIISISITYIYTLIYYVRERMRRSRISAA
jgi:hypothetical protein